MTDRTYGRAVGRNMLKLINRELMGVSQSLGVKYVGLMTECKQRGRTPALSEGEQATAKVGEIQATLKMCGTKFSDKTWVEENDVAWVKKRLGAAVSGLDWYNHIEEERAVEFRRTSENRKIEELRTYDQKRETEKILIGDLVIDITKCESLVTEYDAYLVCMDDYKWEWPKKEWAECELSGHLKMLYGIKSEDTDKFCKTLGASEVKHLAYVEGGDLVGPSIPAAARAALITAVTDYRGKNGIRSDIDATPRLAGKRDSIVTNPATRMVEMRALVEAL